MTTNPLWYKLIKLLKSNGTITTGLTVPYIFGAYEILGEPFFNIKEVVDYIFENSLDKFPLIQKCPDIQHHVIMLEKKEICNRYFSKFIRFENKENGNKLFISNNTDLGKTYDKVCLNLEMLYFMPIQQNCYSWNKTGNKWEKFSQKEIEIIKSIKLKT